MSSLKRFVRREIINREKTFIARVISDPILLDFDETADGAPVWVCDLDIAGNRPVRNVPIKSDGTGGRFYAQLNQTVTVRRTGLGRMYVVGPGDVSVASLTDQQYNLETLAPGTATSTTFTREFKPYHYYANKSLLMGDRSGDYEADNGASRIITTQEWVESGFEVGDIFECFGTPSNDGIPFTITAFASDTTPNDSVDVTPAPTSEGPFTFQPDTEFNVPDSSRWNDGLAHFPFSQLVDSAGNPI